MENLENEVKTQKPWEKDMERMAEVISQLTETVVTLLGNGSNPTKPASTSPAPTPQRERNPAADIAAQINAGTNKELEKMGKEPVNFGTEDDPAPANGGDQEAETKRLASLIDGETKQIVADQRDQQIRELTAQLAETQRMLSLKK